MPGGWREGDAVGVRSSKGLWVVKEMMMKG